MNTLRSTFARKQREPDFRWRAHDVSRIEGLSDTVFGFAITLLVVSLEVPSTSQELFNALRGFFAFAICFAVLYMQWSHHYLYFRRFGLDDGFTIRLNAVFLFLVLFYVYPLKFVFTYLVDGLLLHFDLVEASAHATRWNAG